MYRRQPTSENPIQNPAFQPVPESQTRTSQQRYQTPMFEASPGVPAQSPQPAPPPTEQGTQRFVSPFQMQPGTFEERIPSAGPSPAGRIQQQQPQASPASVSPATIQQAQRTPFATGIEQAIPSVTPASQTSRTVRAPTGTVQQRFAQAAQPQVQAFQTPGNLGTQAAEPGRPSPRQPPMDIHDAGDELEIDIELPGVSKENIHLAGHERGLTLRAVAEERETEDLVASERGERIFQRNIPLGFGIDPEEVSARFENGVLVVTVPNKAAKGLGSIEIE